MEETELVELLGITSSDLVDAFEYLIEEQRERLMTTLVLEEYDEDE